MLQTQTRPAEHRLTADQAARRSGRVSDVEYELDLDLDRGPRAFAGTATLRFRLSDAGAPLRVDFSGGSVEEVTLNGRPLAVDYNGSFINLPDHALREGANVARVRYGHPYSRSGQGLHRFVDPEDSRVYLHTHFEPYDANRLFPCFDQPDLKAFYTLRVTAPPDWEVVSAAAADAVEEAGDARLWRFPRIGPISTYIFPLHAGDYRVWTSDADGIPLRLFARQSLARHVEPEDWFDLTRRGFAFFQDWFDMAYPYGKYDQLIVPEFNIGGMENVAAVTFSERFVRRGGYTRDDRERLANVLLHEMSHMWFGDLVTPAWWDGLWLKEAFATYMAFLAQAEATEFDDAWHMFYAESKQRAYEADQLVTTHPIEVPVGDTHNAFANFDRITYQKGASVLTQLSHYVGRRAFRDGVRQYLKRHAGGTTRLRDFIGALESAADRDLAHWVREWLEQAGLNTLEVELECRDGVVERLCLRQSAPEDHPVLRSHRLQVGMYRLGPDDTAFEAAIVPVVVRGERTDVEAAGGVACPTLVYPNHDDWAFVKVRLDDATIAALRRGLPRVTDPLLRSMFLQSFWDMTRDARLGLFEYVDMALEFAAAETSDRVRRQLSAALREGADLLWKLPAGADPQRAETALRIEEFAWARIAGCPPGSDRRMLWIDTFTAVAHSADGQARLASLLDDGHGAGGAPLDQDRRWQAVVRLNALGTDDADGVRERELAGDASDSGRRMSMAAQAAWPDEANKRRWLDRVRDTQADLSLARRRAIMASLFPAHQYELHQAFAEDILDTLGDVGRRHEDAFLLSYGDLIPRLCRPESVDRLSVAVDSSGDIHPILFRALRIAHQEDARYLAISRLAAAAGHGDRDASGGAGRAVARTPG